MCSYGLYAQYATETVAGLSEVHVSGHTMYKAVINRFGGRTDIVVCYDKYRPYRDGELGEAAYWKLMHFSELKEVAALERSVLLDVFKILGEKRIDLINKKSKALSWLTIILDMDNACRGSVLFDFAATWMALCKISDASLMTHTGMVTGGRKSGPLEK